MSSSPPRTLEAQYAHAEAPHHTSAYAGLDVLSSAEKPEKYAESLHFGGQHIQAGGLSSNELLKEAQYLEKRLVNISDDDLYRVYKNKWANPDLAPSTGHAIYSSHKPPRLHDELRENLEMDPVVGPAYSKGNLDAAEEWYQDFAAIDREKLVSWMMDPERAELDAEPLYAALFPDLENSPYPGWEMQKFENKMEDIHPDMWAVTEPVRRLHARFRQIKKRYYQEVEPAGGIVWADPIKQYEFQYDPLTRLVTSVEARQGRLADYANPAHVAKVKLQNLYDTKEYNERVESQLSSLKDSDKDTPPTAFFLQYAKAKYKKAKRNGEKLDQDYWKEVITPFEYHPKEAPLERPVFIEIPEIDIIQEGKYTIHNKITSHAVPGSIVVFDYVATVEGEPNNVIDSSYRNGEPISAVWGKSYLPKCLSMTLDKMDQGARAKVKCPPRLLFGLNGWPKRGYPPGRTIEFDIKMHKVTDPLAENPNVLYDDYDQRSPF